MGERAEPAARPAQQAAPLRVEGRAWVFGHNLALDGEIMAFRFTKERETNPAVLKQHVLEAVDPEFAREARPGDLIVAGRRFGHGNPHVYAFLGMQGLGVGLLAESIPRGSFRNAIAAGVPTLPRCPAITAQVASGERLRVDFGAGTVVLLDSGRELRFEPLPPFLLEILSVGGAKEWLKMQVARRVAAAQP